MRLRNALVQYSRHCTKCFICVLLTEVEDKIGKSVPISHMSEVVAKPVITINDLIKSHICVSESVVDAKSLNENFQSHYNAYVNRLNFSPE